ncbi:TetR/AcrR family transcriptional regulator [Leucobacter weissii]|uniref:TetR/AcrR family transcriptional regulator n=1 Tax=Leucobacter weissii TaxID=1983706 RepID=A0A939SCI7_9MICO|nr:TetR/AcrR family transcriptional regulator [Leucobacter weissii]MBO1902485.1 TetR/AcrR family transcriptional regulator [Leucobacter weissii]
MNQHVEAHTTGAHRVGRDADRTRAALIAAASERFARVGYAATTVREICADAGANVSLINRYFGSKAGLFERCLTDAIDQLTDNDDAPLVLHELPAALTRQITATTPPGATAQVLLLLLRSSDNVQAERARTRALHTIGDRLAGASTAPDARLRGQLLLAATIGITALRTTDLRPLADATPDALAAPMRDLITALLGPAKNNR